MDAGALRQLRVAIVHERFTETGGSERCVEQFHELWPDAVVHAAVLNPEALPRGLRDADIRPTGLQRLYRGGRGYAHLLPLLPAAMSRIDVGDVDLVITSHHAFSNRVRAPEGVPVVSYTYTPARWLWEPAMLSNEVGGRAGRAALRAFARAQRGPDLRAAQRVTQVVAISHHVANRIARWWGRDAQIVYPPVDSAFYTPDPAIPREDFFLLAGRLVPYKQPEIAVAAAARAGVRLVVAGDGRSRDAVEAAAGPKTEILGAVDDDTLRDLYRKCRALVFPGEEDFGIVPLEAQACGTPVVARKIGGVLDTIVDGRTGVLYEGDGPEALATALRVFDAGEFATDTIRAHALRFSPERFREAFVSAVAAGM
jgi:glycosyltransferase involved in cell wall biosynthesis